MLCRGVVKMEDKNGWIDSGVEDIENGYGEGIRHAAVGEG